MKKNPGRRERRWMESRNRKDHSDKKMAINEQNMMWLLQRKHQFKDYAGTFLAGFNLDERED